MVEQDSPRVHILEGESRPLDETTPKLFKQLNECIRERNNILKRKNRLTSEQESLELPFLRARAFGYIVERNNRANEIVSSRVNTANEIADSIFPCDTFGAFCIDGRNYRATIFGTPPGQGGSIRSLAGDLSSFEDDENGGLMLNKGSDTANMLDRYFQKPKSERKSFMCQVLDSHVECMARLIAEKEEMGRTPKDHGLLADIIRKRQLSKGLTRYVRDYHPREHIFPIQFTFNPNTGYGYMGLDLIENFEYAFSQGGYLGDVLTTLVEEGKALSTQKIAEQLEPQLDQLFVHINWDSAYESSMHNFWSRVRKLVLQDDVMNPLKTQVVKLFGEDLPQEEITQRALLLLTNAFNGYLQTRSADGVYPRGKHEEELIVTQEQSFGPFTIQDFSVYNGSRVPYDTRIASTVIRKNRKEGRVVDPTGTVTDPHEFSELPIHNINDEIVRAPLDEEGWKKLDEISFKDLPDDWFVLDEDVFRKRINEIWPELPRSITEALVKLQRKSVWLHTDSETKRAVAYGKLFPIFAIVDKNRKVRRLVPLYWHGHEAA